MQNDAGNTALIVSAGNSNKDSSIETVKLLLDNGTNVNLVNKTGYSALKATLIYNDIETAKLLLEHGADPVIDIECSTVECEKMIASYR